MEHWSISRFPKTNVRDKVPAIRFRPEMILYITKPVWPLFAIVYTMLITSPSLELVISNFHKFHKSTDNTRICNVASNILNRPHTIQQLLGTKYIRGIVQCSWSVLIFLDYEQQYVPQTIMYMSHIIRGAVMISDCCWVLEILWNLCQNLPAMFCSHWGPWRWEWRQSWTSSSHASSY